MAKEDINIIEMMRAAGAKLVYLDTGTPYFQYGRTYRGIASNQIERLDRRLFIHVHNADDVQVLFYPDGLEWYNLQSRNFKSMRDALEWTESEVK